MSSFEVFGPVLRHNGFRSRLHKLLRQSVNLRAVVSQIQAAIEKPVQVEVSYHMRFSIHAKFELRIQFRIDFLTCILIDVLIAKLT